MRGDRRANGCRWTYADTARAGDHMWWISSMRRFTADYPGWVQRFDLRATLEQILQQHVTRWV